jgi:hypothetical protein
MDHHTVAMVSISGSCLDVLGSLYLAYDLLGSQHGPLRLLTRAVTNSIIYGVGYGLGISPFFGLCSGTAAGFTSAIELNRVARGHKPFGLAWQSVFSAIRGAAYALGLWRMAGAGFAILFAVLITVGQILGYSRGISPTMDYRATLGPPRLSRRQLWSTMLRTVGYASAALVCIGLFHRETVLFAIRVGLTTGTVTGLLQLLHPYIEYYADNLPPRLLGALGIVLILIGFSLQSFQYWLSLFDVHLS